LVSMLRPLEKQGVFKIWHDREITAGNEWYQDIQNAINTCDLALLLVSIDFLNSRFIQEDELPRLLQLRKEKGLRVIPIIVRHCTWTSVPILKDLQALPKDGRPVISFKGAGQPDRIWTEIVQRIEEVARRLLDSERV
jgi:TIR domain